MRYGFIIALFLTIILPNKIQAQYEIMFSNHYPPYNFVDENGKLTGFNVEIIESIINITRADINLKVSDWKTINQALENGEIHAISGNYLPKIQDNQFIYTISTVNTSHCFLYNTDRINHFTLDHFRTLIAPTISIYKNEVLMYYIWSINPTTKFLFFDNYKDLIQSLENENVYCVFSQRVGGLYYAEEYGIKNIGASEHRVLERNMGFKVSKDHPELAELINTGMEVILANGTYEKIYNKWIPSYDQTYVKWQKYVEMVIIIAVLILSITLALVIFISVLRNQVTKKTNDLRSQLELNSNMMIELGKEKERAEESDRMKSAFLANMSHEIRTPMNGILGFADLLRTEELSDEEQQQFIDVILRSGNRMLGTINNIIDVSKLESGGEKLHIHRVNLNEMLDELQEFFSAEAQINGIQLMVEMNDASTINFQTDEHKINSIFTNLIKNAIKFTIEGFIKINLEVEEKQLHFIIEDSGVGIAKDKQESIFDEFVQADFSHSNGIEGSGLGLSITRGYVQLLKGNIQMTSTVGKGTRFVVQIPNFNEEQFA
ncbi:MAG: transporter substrate-binding domain-containing protein [Bacteroidales bacterium]|nr:transporter substrate-binding domain-containing protein [Bacteroidales bacterium]